MISWEFCLDLQMSLAPSLEEPQKKNTTEKNLKVFKTTLNVDTRIKSVSEFWTLLVLSSVTMVYL